MALTKDRKTDLIKSFETHEGDTGSPEVQIAILSERITYLTEHFKVHAKDIDWILRVVSVRTEV